MYVLPWLFCAGLLILALVFALAADCVASTTGPAREEREDAVDGASWDTDMSAAGTLRRRAVVE
jgi:hypothetical protein